ncbi:MAG: PASTA domain-containing protein, partial [Candidatus Hydrogenedentes bacterium]|nr:PASTA domain-containing protein [Candidatus Hydrogenedentota bacterium]
MKKCLARTAMLAVICIIVAALTGCPSPRRGVVPNVAGMTQGAAETAIEAAGYMVGTVTEDYHPTSPVGTVGVQQPAAETRAALGSAVNLVISKGPNKSAANQFDFVRVWPKRQQFTRDPGSVTSDSMGNVYVANALGNKVLKYAPDGTLITAWGSAGTGDGQFGWPRSLAVGLSGNVYVLDADLCRVQVFDANGNFLSKWGTQGAAAGEFDNPSGIDCDSLGNVYVSDAGNNRV